MVVTGVFTTTKKVVSLQKSDGRACGAAAHGAVEAASVTLTVQIRALKFGFLRVVSSISKSSWLIGIFSAARRNF